MALTDAETPRSPGWWMLRLGRQIRDRNENIERWHGYYTGEGQALPEGPKGAIRAYQEFQKKARTNLCALPVEADVHRLRLIGILGEDGKALAEPWKWWQKNKLDSKQHLVHRTSLSLSASYVSVGRHPKDSRRPLITPEHPKQVIVENDPATGEPVAAFKAWYDSIDRVGKATVATDEFVVHFQTDPRSPVARLPWGANNWTVVDEKVNEFGRPPVAEFPCQPDLEDQPRPVFARIMDIQDRINMGVLNRMTAERYSAFRQKYGTGMTFKKETDPETGLEVVVNPYLPDPGALWTQGNKDAKFGEFSQTDLMGYLKTFETDVRTLFVMTSTPAYYMPGDLINVSTDTITALDTNHVAKVGEEQDLFGESWELVFSLAGQVADSDIDFDAAEVRWKDPRQLNPAVVADMGVKKHAMGYPLTMVAEDMGDSPARVERLRTEVAAERLLDAAAAPRQETRGNVNPPAFQQPGQPVANPAA
ncbi:phage portal protein [Amycolatopsis japonica]